MREAGALEVDGRATRVSTSMTPSVGSRSTRAISGAASTANQTSSSPGGSAIPCHLAAIT